MGVSSDEHSRGNQTRTHAVMVEDRVVLVKMLQIDALHFVFQTVYQLAHGARIAVDGHENLVLLGIPLAFPRLDMMNVDIFLLKVNLTEQAQGTAPRIRIVSERFGAHCLTRIP